MNKKFIRLLSLILAVLTCFLCVGCSSHDEPGVSETVTATDGTVTAPATEAPTEPEPELPRNPYTGLPCEERLVGKRPIAVVINNLRDALPQSGLSKCDILYEVLAEGGILRLCGVILDYENAGTLGSMRSSRPYFIELAFANDAVFVHAGGSDRAYETIRNLKCENVDGVKMGPFTVGNTKIYWRDQGRLNSGYSLEHTMFTSGSNVALAIGSKNYRTTLQNSDFTAFKFKKTAGALNGASASYVKIPHSNYSVSEFRYNAEDKLYYHSQYGKAHIDEQDGKQVATDNLFILFAKEANYPGQSYLNISLTGSGSGYYICGGQSVPLTWKRESQTGAFTYYAADGTELEVNPGRSYISIVDQKTASDITIS